MSTPARKQPATSKRSQAAQKGWETRKRNAALKALLAASLALPAANHGNPELPPGWDLDAPVYEVSGHEITPILDLPPPLPTTYVLKASDVGIRPPPLPVPGRATSRLHARAVRMGWAQ